MKKQYGQKTLEISHASHILTKDCQILVLSYLSNYYCSRSFVFKFTYSILYIAPPTMFSFRTVKALVLQDSKHPFIDRRNGNKWTCESDCSWSRIPNLVRKRVAWAGIYRKRLKKKSIMALISTTIPSIRSPTHQLSILLSWERASWLWWPV